MKKPFHSHQLVIGFDTWIPKRLCKNQCIWKEIIVKKTLYLEENAFINPLMIDTSGDDFVGFPFPFFVISISEFSIHQLPYATATAKDLLSFTFQVTTGTKRMKMKIPPMGAVEFKRLG